MGLSFRPFTVRNFPFHLKKASSLLKGALNREALHTLHPWEDFINYLERVTGQFDFSTIANVRKSNSQVEIIDLVYTSWPEDVVTASAEQNVLNDPLILQLYATNSQKLGKCFSISEIISVKEYRNTSFYNEYALPYKVDSITQVLFPVDQKNLGVLGVISPSGHYEINNIIKNFLSALAEDIGMALHQRRLLQRLQAAEGFLHRLNLGVILLNERGFVEMVNEQANTILSAGDPLFMRYNRLYTTDPGSTGKLDDLCYRLLRGESRQREQQLILKSSKGNPALQVMVLNLENELSESLTGGYVPIALFIKPFSINNKPSVDLEEIYQEIYGCSKKQAQVAALFTKGFSEIEIAQRLGVGRETVRSHLTQASEKLRDVVRSSKRRKNLFWDVAMQHHWPLR